MDNMLTAVLKILISGILSGIIGFEREKHGREAGLRTMILVGIGTTTILISSLQVYYLFSNIQNPVLRIDPARIAYGVVTGMGFLGAGVIIKDRRRIRGLTTASCLWLVTSIGIAVGVGLYFLSLFITIFSIIVLYFLKLLEKKIPIDIYNKITVKINIDKNLKETIENLIKQENFKILTCEIKTDKEKNEMELNFTVRYRRPQNIEKIFEEMLKMEGVKFISII
ncbi:MAG: MgtC/SapB family protein [Candidatus Omnitrophica bacterium]|nr:MgtC/SapB family protein [Candidatus Omnitrophota bacterium]MCM8807598.1 MgtC/SapB family protein [Candidatus Omnitrophota bacterium]